MMAYFSAQVNALSKLSGDERSKREVVFLGAQACIITLK
jgi:hypothetical protein